MFLHLVKDASGHPTDKVCGLSNCHVLRDNTKADYEFQEGDVEDRVRVCPVHCFQQALDDITQAVSGALYENELAAAELARVEANPDTSPAGKQRKKRLERRCEELDEDIAALQQFHADVTQNWSNLQLQRDVGHVVYATAIRVDVNERFTADWAVFEATKAKFSKGFEGNVVFLGNKFTPGQLREMFSRGTTMFQYPDDGKLRLVSFASTLVLNLPPELDSFGNRCLTVGKDGSKTNLTNDVGVESKEYAVYNSGYNPTQPFSAAGDSGSVVWYASGDKASIVGQLHSGVDKDGSSSQNIYVSYLTPGWWLEAEIRKKYPHADFFHEAW